MHKLVRGVHKFQQEIAVHQQQFFAELAKGQQPHTLFITCSDSRINPNLLTQTGPGEILILRNAGHIIPTHGAASSGEAATIEYALVALGVRDIVICGHTHCGAMMGLVHPESIKDLPALRSWLSHAEATRRILTENYADRTGDELLNIAIQENVLVQLDNMRTNPVVAARLASGSLQLHGWVYKLDTGQVFAYDEGEGQFLPLARYQPKPVQPRSFAELPPL